MAKAVVVRQVVIMFDANPDATLATKLADQIVREGLLAGVRKLSAIAYRTCDGTVRQDLIGCPDDGRPKWLFEPKRNEAEAEVRDRLIKEHSHWLRACGSPAISDLVECAAGCLASDSLAMVHWAIRTPDGWRQKHPDLAFFISCRGSDTAVGVDRVLARHQGDLTVDLARLISRHRTAEVVAAEWAGRSAIGAIDAPAAGMVKLCGLNISDIIVRLKEFGDWPFQFPKIQIDGTFYWRDFTIAVRVQGPPEWSLDGDEFTLTNKLMAISFTESFEGDALSRVIDFDEMPVDPIIASFRHAGGDLVVKVDRHRLLITSSGELGQSWDWPGR